MGSGSPRSALMPAWSHQFSQDAIEPVGTALPMTGLTREWAWGGSSGSGVKVAVVDSGIEADHPAVDGRVAGYAAVTETLTGIDIETGPHEDNYGHGTACAGIIRSLAPDCELYSVRVLGAGLTGRGGQLAAGLRWAIENGMDVCNLSLGTTNRGFFGVLHELADLACFRNVILVTAANNLPVPSFPSTYASVISVAAHEGQDPELFYCNPRPPVEFGAPGIDVRVAWKGGMWITATGNSFAAPHITGLVARTIAKHPEITLFQMKVLLRALAANSTLGKT